MNDRIGWILLAFGAVILASDGSFIGLLLLVVGAYIVWNSKSRSRGNSNRTSPPDWPERRRTAWEHDGRKCGKCRRPVTLSNGEAHHIKPVADGGTDEISNLMYLCYACHAKMPGHQHMKRRWKYRRAIAAQKHH
jgi:5-methylcytosine-specific restriction endonuclease McrA